MSRSESKNSFNQALQSDRQQTQKISGLNFQNNEV